MEMQNESVKNNQNFVQAGYFDRVDSRWYWTRGLLKPAGYNPYLCPVSVPMPGYRRVDGYGFEKGRSVFFFWKKPVVSVPAARARTHIPVVITVSETVIMIC
jgi:hypothetical protein